MQDFPQVVDLFWRKSRTYLLQVKQRRFGLINLHSLNTLQIKCTQKTYLLQNILEMLSIIPHTVLAPL
jgi:hypothetical protein